MSAQQPNGWFAENDLDFHDQPLTHTVGYVLEGLHGIGVRLGRQDYLDAVDRTLGAISTLIRPDGYLAGRFRKDWTPAVDWVCLTGSSQIAGVFLRMYLQTGKIEYFHAGRRLLGFVCFTQELMPGIPGIDGGIRGSYPFEGQYGQWCVLNWATKFFADSVMDYLAAEQKARWEGGSLVPRRHENRSNPVETCSWRPRHRSAFGPSGKGEPSLYCRRRVWHESVPELGPASS